MFRVFTCSCRVIILLVLVHGAGNSPELHAGLWGLWNSHPTQGAGTGAWLGTASAEQRRSGCSSDSATAFEQPVPTRWLLAVGHHSQLGNATPLQDNSGQQHTGTPALHSCSFFPLESSITSSQLLLLSTQGETGLSFCPQPVFPHPTKNQNGNSWIWAVLKGGQRTRMAASPQDVSLQSAAFK